MGKIHTLSPWTRRLSLLLLLVCSLHSVCYAQEKVEFKEKVQQKTTWYKFLVDSLIDRYQHINTDTAYISRPPQNWTIRLKQDTYGNIFTTYIPEMTVRLSSRLKTTMGVTCNYRGLSLSLSVNPAKLFRRTTNTEYNINYYNNRYGADVSLTDLRNIRGTTTMGESVQQYQLTNTRWLSLSANLYYVFSGKRFSYPAAFTHSWIQKRSAGSFLAATSYYQGRINSDFDTNTGILSKDKSIDMKHVSLGVGYAYNYVPNRHWLLHISVVPSMLLWKKYDVKVLVDDTTGEPATTHIPSHFPELFNVGRLSFTYSWRKYILGLSSVVQTSVIGRDGDMTISNTRWKARAIIGVRL